MAVQAFVTKPGNGTDSVNIMKDTTVWTYPSATVKGRSLRIIEESRKETTFRHAVNPNREVFGDTSLNHAEIIIEIPKVRSIQILQNGGDEYIMRDRNMGMPVNQDVKNLKVYYRVNLHGGCATLTSGSRISGPINIYFGERKDAQRFVELFEMLQNAI